VNILCVYPCIFDVAKKLTDNEYVPWKKCPLGCVHFRALPIWM